MGLAWRLWLVLGVLGLAGCGLTNEPSASSPVEPNVDGGGEAEPEAPEPEAPEPMPLMDWQWFLSGPGQVGTPAPVTPQNGVIALSFAANGGPKQLQTHHHFDLLADRESVRFDASATRPVEVLIAFTGLAPLSDYWTDLAAGTPWMAAPVSIGVEADSYAVSLDSLAAQGPGTPRPLRDAEGMAIWFLIEDTADLELELSNIRLE